MILRSFIAGVLILLLASCAKSVTSIKNASAQYKLNRDYASLVIIYKTLSKGISRTDVLALLGEPDYSPTEGQYYYSSSRSEYSKERDGNVVVGLVVDYRNERDTLTKFLQKFWLGPIGE